MSPRAVAACFAPASIASKYGDPCSFGTKATLTLPPEEVPTEALPPVDEPPSFFLVHPPAIIVTANATQTPPTTRWEIFIDFSSELDWDHMFAPGLRRLRPPHSDRIQRGGHPEFYQAFHISY